MSIVYVVDIQDPEMAKIMWDSYVSNLLSQETTSKVAEIANNTITAGLYIFINCLDKYHGYSFYAHHMMKVATNELDRRKAVLVEQLGDGEAAEVMFALQLMGDK